MNKILDFLKLIRWINLLFVALTQIFIHFCLIQPILSNGFVHIESSLGTSGILLLALSTSLIAGAGYIINDYFDVKSDEINKPNRIIVDRSISRRKAQIWHLVLNILGIGIGFYLAFKVDCWPLGFIHIGSMALLWWYSSYWKKTWLAGNILVSLLTAFVVITVLLYERSLFLELKGRMPEIFYYIFYFCLSYAGFAFLMTMLRELVKDMEDMKGDKADGGKTVPIVSGIIRTKQICYFLIALIIIPLVYYQYDLAINFKESQNLSFHQVPPIRLIFTFVQIPLVYLVLLLMKADKPADFKKISNLIKLIMLAGILYLTYLYFSVG